MALATMCCEAKRPLSNARRRPVRGDRLQGSRTEEANRRQVSKLTLHDRPRLSRSCSCLLSVDGGSLGETSL